ncbi:hypothetical protein CsSME_00024558 [Camellia sinensis var. sinensis]
MARPRPQVATTTAVLILFLVAEVVSSGQATTIVLRPPHGGSIRHTMFLPLFLSPPPNSYSGNSSPSVHRQIQGSDPLHPNARMLLYDDLLLNGSVLDNPVWVLIYGLLLCCHVKCQRPEILRIGTLLSYNSVIGRVSKVAIETAIADVNADPSILNGTQLKLIMEDTGSALNLTLPCLSFQVKELAKTHGINDSKSGTLNSYCLSMLIIFHFQTCVPPLLPPLKEIYPGNIVDDLIVC